MHWLKKDRWKTGIALAGIILLLVLMVWVPVSAVGAYEGTSELATLGTATLQVTPTEDVTMAALKKVQLTLQVKQLQDQLQNQNSWLVNNSTALIAAFTTLVVALFGISQWAVNRRDERRKEKELYDKESKDRQAAQDKELDDRKAERERQDEEQRRWLKDQEAQREKQAEDRFQKVVEGLGSERTEARVGAAIMLRTFLQPSYEQFYRQTFDLVVAHLRLRKSEQAPPRSAFSEQLLAVLKERGEQKHQQNSVSPIPLDSLSQALILVFQEAFPHARDMVKEQLASEGKEFDPHTLDASSVRLDRAYLSQADFVEVWLTHASLPKVNLSGANLSRARLYQANFYQANLSGANFYQANLDNALLVEANLSGVNLSWASLIGANLGEANLSGANLSSARFEKASLIGANLSDANLRSANLNMANFSGANLSGANLDKAALRKAILTDAHPEHAQSLHGTKMIGVIGLDDPKQRAECIKKGAIFDEIQLVPASDTNSSSSLPPLQIDDSGAVR